MLTAIGEGSREMSDIVPVIVGPPGCNANGGDRDCFRVESCGELATMGAPNGSRSNPVVKCRSALDATVAASRGLSGLEMSTTATSSAEEADTYAKSPRTRTRYAPFSAELASDATTCGSAGLLISTTVKRPAVTWSATYA